MSRETGTQCVSHLPRLLNRMGWEEGFPPHDGSNHQPLICLFWKTTSAETKCPHEAAYDAFLCGSGSVPAEGPPALVKWAGAGSCRVAHRVELALFRRPEIGSISCFFF